MCVRVAAELEDSFLALVAISFSAPKREGRDRDTVAQKERRREGNQSERVHNFIANLRAIRNRTRTAVMSAPGCCFYFCYIRY